MFAWIDYQRQDKSNLKITFWLKSFLPWRHRRVFHDKGCAQLNSQSTSLLWDLNTGLELSSLPKHFEIFKLRSLIRKYQNPESAIETVFSASNQYSDIPHSAYLWTLCHFHNYSHSDRVSHCHKTHQWHFFCPLQIRHSIPSLNPGNNIQCNYTSPIQFSANGCNKYITNVTGFIKWTNNGQVYIKNQNTLKALLLVMNNTTKNENLNTIKASIYCMFLLQMWSFL